jgi:hypothetical protein
MKLPVLIEANPAGGFTAKLGPPFGVVGHGGTMSAAVADVKTIVEAANRAGRIATVDVALDAEIDPIAHLLDDPASLPDDELTAAWIQTMKDRRLEREREDELSGRIG